MVPVELSAVVPVELPKFESCHVELPFPPRFHPLAAAFLGLVSDRALQRRAIEAAPCAIVTKAKDSPLIAGVYVH